MLNGQNGIYGFHSTTGTKGMTRISFGGTHFWINRIKQKADGRSFCNVVILCARAVQVDIVDICWLKTGTFQRTFHSQEGSGSFRRGSRLMKCIIGIRVTGDPGNTVFY